MNKKILWYDILFNHRIFLFFCRRLLLDRKIPAVTLFYIKMANTMKPKMVVKVITDKEEETYSLCFSSSANTGST